MMMWLSRSRVPNDASVDRSGAPYPDPNRIEAVHLDDIAVPNEVEILPASGLPTLCSPNTHHVDVAVAVNHSIAGADVPGHSDLC